jgi:hypothetical protein
MKKTFPFICTALMAVGLMTSCSSEDSSSGEIAVTSYDARKAIEDSNDLMEKGLITFGDDLTSAIARFAVSNSGGMNFAMAIAGSNGKKVAEFPAIYSDADKMYHVTMTNLSPGTIYFYHIVAYDAEGNFVSRANEGSFTLPQKPGPGPLTGLIAHAPTRALTVITELNPDGSYTYHYTCDGYITGDEITPAVEYSTDGGETWKSAETNGIIDFLPIGKILVRKAATTSTLAGESVEVIIPGNSDITGEGGYADGENARGARLTK